MVEKEQSPKYGIPLHEISDQILDEVLAIYYRVVVGTVDVSMLDEDLTGQAQRAHFHRRTLEDLTQIESSEWRLGSRLSGHSKLFVKLGWGVIRERLVYFECNDNLGLHVPEELKIQGRQMEEDFEEAVNNYLLIQGTGKQVVPAWK